MINYWALFSTGLAIGFLLMLLTLRKVVHLLVSFFGVLLSIAFYFIAKGSPFLASVQLLLYAGGIAILLSFMLLFASGKQTQIADQPLVTGTYNRFLGGAISLVILYILLKPTIGNIQDAYLMPEEANQLAEWPANLGLTMAQHYLLAFEAMALLLLLAMLVAGRFGASLLEGASQRLTKGTRP